MASTPQESTRDQWGPLDRVQYLHNGRSEMPDDEQDRPGGNESEEDDKGGNGGGN